MGRGVTTSGFSDVSHLLFGPFTNLFDGDTPHPDEFNMTTFWTLLACVADGAIVGAVIGGLLGYRQRRRPERLHEREWVRQRYTALLDRGFNAPLSLPKQREVTQLSRRWCELGLPQTPLGAPFLDRQISQDVMPPAASRRPGCDKNLPRPIVILNSFLHIPR
jgi:hypothetical protein